MHLYQSLAEFTLSHKTMIATFRITVCDFFLRLDSEPRCFPPHNRRGKASPEGWGGADAVWGGNEAFRGGSEAVLGHKRDGGDSARARAAMRALRAVGGAPRARVAGRRNCGKSQPISGGVAARPLLPAPGEPRGSRLARLGGARAFSGGRWGWGKALRPRGKEKEGNSSTERGT